MTNQDIRSEVRDRYAAAADAASCCEPGNAEAFDTSSPQDFGTWLYEAGELAEIPDGAALAALGCGNPTAVTALEPGDVVLDLGSGAGIDVLLSARRVGPTGFVYGLDMTEEMLVLARRHRDQAGATNVEFLKGEIEDIPLDDASIDVIISNCVINLSVDKPAVLAEMFRVLRPGGRIGIADVVADDELSATQRLERGSWVGCIAGALNFTEYRSGLEAVGFADITIDSTHAVADGMHSAIVAAIKPAG